MSEAPVNQFACFDSCTSSYGHEMFVVVCAITFFAAVTMVVVKLESERSHIAFPIAGLVGFCSVAAACVVAEMFTYQMPWRGESSLTIVIFAAGAGAAAGVAPRAARTCATTCV